MARNTAESASVVPRGDAISPGAGGDQTTNPETGDWFDLFPSEDSSQVPDDPARVHQIGRTGRAGCH